MKLLNSPIAYNRSLQVDEPITCAQVTDEDFSLQPLPESGFLREHSLSELRSLARILAGPAANGRAHAGRGWRVEGGDARGGAAPLPAVRELRSGECLQL